VLIMMTTIGIDDTHISDLVATLLVIGIVDIITRLLVLTLVTIREITKEQPGAHLYHHLLYHLSGVYPPPMAKLSMLPN
jgi:hypothetical protein